LPPALFAVAVGLFGLAGAWRRAAAFGWPFADVATPVPLWLATCFWAVTLFLYGVKCRRHPRAVAREFFHPVQGSLLALGPMSTLLAVVQLGTPAQGIWLVFAGAALAVDAVLAGRVLIQLATGRFPENAVTPALYLPLTGVPLVGAMALAVLGYPHFGMPLFGLGIGGWALVEMRVMQQFFAGPMPEPLRPTIGIELAPAVICTLTAGMLWPNLPVEALLVALGLAAVPFLTVLARYRWWGEVSFSLGFWSFAFPLAALASVMLEVGHRGGWTLWPGVAALAFASAITGGLLLRTVGLLFQQPVRGNSH
ncbi:hypothetical protein E4K72_19705, partial [Oxalobacteraceae bacterium OM1]